MYPFAAYLLWVLLTTLQGCHSQECTEEPINAIETRIQIPANLTKFSCHCIEPHGAVVKVLNRKIYHQEKVHSKFDQDALVLRAKTSPKSCSFTWTDPDGERRNAPCKLREPQDQTFKSTIEQTAAVPEESTLERHYTVSPVLLAFVLILIGCVIIIMVVKRKLHRACRNLTGRMRNARETRGGHLAGSPLSQTEECDPLNTREDNGQEYSNPPEEDSTTTSWLEKDTDRLEPTLRHHSLDSNVKEKYSKYGPRHTRLFSLDPTMLQKKKKTTRQPPDQTGETIGWELPAGLSGAKKKVNPRQQQPSGETGPLKRVKTMQELPVTSERSLLKKVKSLQELQPSGDRTPLVPSLISENTGKTENADIDTNIQEPEETENSDTKTYRMKSD